MGSVRFDADGEDLVRSGGLGLTGNTVPFTVTGWMKRATTRTDYQCFIAISPGTTADGALIIAESASNSLFRYTNIDGSGNKTNGPTVANGTWYFFALTLTGTAATLYWRTDAQSTLSSSTVTPDGALDDNLTAIQIGEDPHTVEWFNGSVTSIKLWNAVLSSSEILAESYSRPAVRTSNLQGEWRLDGVTDKSDYSGNGRTLTGGNNASTDSTEPTFTTTPTAQPNALQVATNISKPGAFTQFEGVQLAAENDASGISLALDAAGIGAGNSRFLIVFASVELTERNWVGCECEGVLGTSLTFVEQADGSGSSMECFYWLDDELPESGGIFDIMLSGSPAGTAVHAALFIGAIQSAPVSFDTESLTAAEHAAQGNEVRWNGLAVSDPNAVLVGSAACGTAGTAINNGMGTIIGTAPYSGGSVYTSYRIEATPTTYNELQDFQNSSRSSGIGVVLERSSLGAAPHDLIVTANISQPTIFQTHILQPLSLNVDSVFSQPDTLVKVACNPNSLQTEIHISAPFVGNDYVPIVTSSLQVEILLSQPTLFQQHFVTLDSLQVATSLSSPSIFTLQTIFGNILTLEDAPRDVSVDDDPRLLFVDEEERTIILELEGLER